MRAVYPRMKAVLFVTALITLPLGSQAQPADSVGFLRSVLGFSASDIRDIARGETAVRSLDTEDGREIAIAGAVHVPISPEQYVDQLRDIVTFKRHEAVRQIGTFSQPPRATDVAALTLDRDHVDDLRDCRLHDCDLQLSRDAIAKVQAIDWSGEDAEQQANRLMRQVLADVAAGYRTAGDAALMTYEDKREPVSVAGEFSAMIAATPALLQRFPLLERHIARYPVAATPAVEDILYWSKEDVGPKVIISVTHMAIQRVPEGPVVYVAASKQLYGSHYFDSSLGLTLLLRDDEPTSTILVYVNRSRVDALSGFLGGLKRAIVRSRARSAMSDTLTRIRTHLPTRVNATQ